MKFQHLVVKLSCRNNIVCVCGGGLSSKVITLYCWPKNMFNWYTNAVKIDTWKQNLIDDIWKGPYVFLVAILWVHECSILDLQKKGENKRSSGSFLTHGFLSVYWLSGWVLMTASRVGKQKMMWHLNSQVLSIVFGYFIFILHETRSYSIPTV